MEYQSNPRIHDNIDDFLGARGKKTDQMERELSELPEEDLERLNEYLGCLGDHDPTRDWKNQLANGDADVMFAEAELVYHLRRTFNDVEMNATIHEGENSPDFDACVDLGERQVWIEVTYDRLVEQIEEKGGGWFDDEKTGRKLDNKIREDFEEAQEELGNEDVLVLAIYTEAAPIHQILLGRRREMGGDYEETEYVDGLVTFRNLDGTQIGYESWTEAGEKIREEMDELVKDD